MHHAHSHLDFRAKWLLNATCRKIAVASLRIEIRFTSVLDKNLTLKLPFFVTDIIQADGNVNQ